MPVPVRPAHVTGPYYDQAPDIPTEPRGKETVEDFRRRMEEKAAKRRQYRGDTVRQAEAARRGDALDDERPKPRPRPPAAAKPRPVQVPKPAGPRRESIRPCAGGCGRSTRPSSTSAAAAPGTVSRVRDGMCGTCVRGGTGRRTNIGVDERVKIVEAYLTGESVPQVAARFNRGPEAVRAALVTAGVRLRDDRATNGGQNAKTTQSDPVHVVLAFTQAYTQGATIDQIVARYPDIATSRTYVADVLRRAGVRMRPSANGRTAAPKPA
ncbi:hypothetical protein, partial [Cellulomonas sp. HZM]|uniref:hypothetical protein n=1 Tax=Cellulomonas sp. HZM TaxID=1454010 RepID=UPI000493559E